MHFSPSDSKLLDLMRLTAANGTTVVLKRLEAEPPLARLVLSVGATRQDPDRFFLESIQHYIYAGDTALHIAAAGFQTEIVEVLLRHNANCSATNRRGAQPIHYAADTNIWNSEAQSATVRCLLDAGADPNALDSNGAGPLHRAVRTRSAPAVCALISGGASPNLLNKTGSAPLHLAVQTTGRGGTGTSRAREQQALIVSLLLQHGADPAALNARGKTARDVASDDLRRLLPQADV